MLPADSGAGPARRASGRTAERDPAAGSAVIYLLDVAAPGPDGLPRISRLTIDGHVAVIMLPQSAAGAEGATRPGASPGLLPELAARLAAALAPANAAAPAPPPVRTVFRFGRTWLDLDAARLTDEDGRVVPLTAMEFALLRFFATRRGRVLTRDQILEGAHDRSWDPFDRSIDIRISRIRRKIELNPEKPAVIRTVRGIGYIYDPK